MKRKVKCSFVIEVDVPDDPDYDVYFDIEDNHCPGTGLVGAALRKHIEEHDLIRNCWACALGGTNEVVE
jgi:hypothetical protein